MSSTFLESLAAKQVLPLNLSKRTPFMSGNVNRSKMTIPLAPNLLQEVLHKVPTAERTSSLLVQPWSLLSTTLCETIGRKIVVFTQLLYRL